MRVTIGIDEVGRGPLAGPVVVAALAIQKNFRIKNRALGALKDSKKLSRERREAWFGYLTRHPRVRYAVARVMPRTIDRINITNAANRAALRAYERLNPRSSGHSVYLDGGLYLGNKDRSMREYRAKTVIRGDEKIRAVAMASIIAKVTRDRAMARLSKKYPRYGFEIHKGYGTKRHRAAIAKYGPSPAHRLTFIS